MKRAEQQAVVADIPGTIITNLDRLNYPERYGAPMLDRMFFHSGYELVHPS